MVSSGEGGEPMEKERTEGRNGTSGIGEDREKEREKRNIRY